MRVMRGGGLNRTNLLLLLLNSGTEEGLAVANLHLRNESGMNLGLVGILLASVAGRSNGDMGASGSLTSSSGGTISRSSQIPQTNGPTPSSSAGDIILLTPNPMNLGIKPRLHIRRQPRQPARMHLLAGGRKRPRAGNAHQNRLAREHHLGQRDGEGGIVSHQGGAHRGRVVVVDRAEVGGRGGGGFGGGRPAARFGGRGRAGQGEEHGLVEIGVVELVGFVFLRDGVGEEVGLGLAAAAGGGGAGDFGAAALLDARAGARGGGGRGCLAAAGGFGGGSARGVAVVGTSSGGGSGGVLGLGGSPGVQA